MAETPTISLPESRVKLVLVGEGGVGKTTFIKHHLTGEFERKYIPTLGADVYPLQFTTNLGAIIFDVWDIAGHEKFASVRDDFYVGSQCGIIMFDVTSRITYKNVSNWYDDITRVCQDIPVVLCGNKIDVKERQVKTSVVSFHRKKGIQYFEISVKSTYHFDKPFLWLARRLFADNKLEFVSGPASKSAEAAVNHVNELIKQDEDELKQAEVVPVPVPESDD